MDRKRTRRQFLRTSAAVAFFAGSHSLVGPRPLRAIGESTEPIRHDPLLRSLRLLTAAPLDEMRRFYSGLLGLETLEQSVDRLVLRAGLTRLVFVAATPEQGRPFYHFAFNIPPRKIVAARDWQARRTPLVEWPADRRDPAFPQVDIRHFRSWNAHSVFFWDPADNVLEYIARHELARHDLARHDLDPGDDDPEVFSPDDILYASEIAFVVDDQDGEARRHAGGAGRPVYPPGQDVWWAIGDERGLLLCIPKRPWGTDPARTVHFTVFPTHADVADRVSDGYLFDGYPYRVERSG